MAERETDQQIVQNFENRLRNVKSKYERFFIGLERKPPLREYEELVALVRGLQPQSLRNTSMRFKLNSLIAQFNTLNSYWMNTLRKIEEGTYFRDRNKIRLRDVDRTSTAPNVVLTQSQPLKNQAQSDGELFVHYRAARQKLEGELPKMSPAAFETMIAKQREQLLKQTGAKEIQFRVIVEGGKVKLKAKPIK